MISPFWRHWKLLKKTMQTSKPCQKKTCYGQKHKCWVKAHNCLQRHLSAEVSLSLSYYLSCDFTLHFCTFQSEKQSLLMEGPLICPFLCYFTYTCSHCECAIEINLVKRWSGLFIFKHSFSHSIFTKYLVQNSGKLMEVFHSFVLKDMLENLMPVL